MRISLTVQSFCVISALTSACASDGNSGNPATTSSNNTVSTSTSTPEQTSSTTSDIGSQPTPSTTVSSSPPSPPGIPVPSTTTSATSSSTTASTTPDSDVTSNGAPDSQPTTGATDDISSDGPGEETTDGATTAPPNTDGSDPVPTQSESPGCSASTAAAGNTNVTVDVGGTSRKFILHVPPNYDGSKPVPFILDLHPLGGSGSSEQQSSGYQRIADAEGLVIAFPDGIDNAWNVGPCCTNSRDVDDVAFARKIVETVAAQACIDMKRVYAVGFSMGGGMSHYLACNATDVFAAVAPAAFDLLVPEEQTCEPSRPISVLTFRGTQDTTSPFNGGPGPSGRATFEGAYGSFERWREMDGCNEVNSVDGDCTTYTECDAGVEVALCVKEGGGHATGDANVGWAFLKRFALP